MNNCYVFDYTLLTVKNYGVIAQYGSVKKIVGWVERSETQQSHASVGLRLRQTTLTFHYNLKIAVRVLQEINYPKIVGWFRTLVRNPP
ncbi:hypothetical protein [Anabaena sp. CCY 0017]|uniref:hypothetical protein n=1 Tax=Anabaena sp. CCY 0017 TaxID=3103866 RepID=UPI0039C7093A